MIKVQNTAILCTTIYALPTNKSNHGFPATMPPPGSFVSPTFSTSRLPCLSCTELTGLPWSFTKAVTSFVEICIRLQELATTALKDHANSIPRLRCGHAKKGVANDFVSVIRCVQKRYGLDTVNCPSLMKRIRRGQSGQAGRGHCLGG